MKQREVVTLVFAGAFLAIALRVYFEQGTLGHLVAPIAIVVITLALFVYYGWLRIKERPHKSGT